jgi:Rab9 effector protein with kelch motifs
VPPEPRYYHTSCLVGPRIIIFGGKGKNKVFRDLHALDPVTMTWFQGPEGGGAPCARYGHSANIVNNTKMYIFGGSNGTQYFNDLYILDLESTSWSKPEVSGPAPLPRMGHSSIIVGPNMLVFGGFRYDDTIYKSNGTKHGTALQECYYNDIRVLDTETFVWSRLRVSGTPPEPRYGHTLDVSESDIIMFGGWSYKSGNRTANEGTGDSCSYFMSLNTETMSWTPGKYYRGPPSNRYGHSTTAIGPHLLIFGGWEYSKAQNEVIVLRDCATVANTEREPSKELIKETSKGQENLEKKEQDIDEQSNNTEQKSQELNTSDKQIIKEEVKEPSNESPQ